MTFTVDLTRRDFSGPLRPACTFTPERLSWTAFGGCDRAVLHALGASDDLLTLTALLRCPVMVRDLTAAPVWWGFVEKIEVQLDQVMVTVTMERLFNRVSVRYSHLSPDNRLAEETITPPADNLQSQAEYGVKETTISLDGIDDDRALSLRDTFLSQHAFPLSELSQAPDPQPPHARLFCSGWFNTLSWRTYDFPDGFYANYGPGPGVFAFGNASASNLIAQAFHVSSDGLLQYAYFRLRKVGNPTRNLVARLYANASSSPGTLLASSQPVPGGSLPPQSYAWFRFAFSTPYPLTAGSTYWIALSPSGLDPAHFFQVKVDENCNFNQDGRSAKFWNGAAWSFLPSITAPDTRPQLYFRVVCTSDTAAQLLSMSTAGGQFLNRITAPAAGRQTSPFRFSGRTCLEEALALLRLGTSNDRLLLATVTPDRDLHFFEQPDPAQADIYLDRHSHFYNNQGIKLLSYHPPVGHFARLSATNTISLPWDRHRLPACFIAGAEYLPASDQIIIHAF